MLLRLPASALTGLAHAAPRSAVLSACMLLRGAGGGCGGDAAGIEGVPDKVRKRRVSRDGRGDRQRAGAAPKP
eukprot:936601-Rhodomonas_salina.1